jgi:hypothetical protein
MSIVFIQSLLRSCNTSYATNGSQYIDKTKH